MTKRQLFEKCNEYGYKIKEEHGLIIINTNFENWMFKPGCQKTTLYHMDRLHTSRSAMGDYHKEFCETVNFEQILTYIREHEMAKYTTKFVTFTVFNQKQYGKKMMLK